MKHLHLDKVNQGNHFVEKQYVGLVKEWDGESVLLGNGRLNIGNLSFQIRETEVDALTVTYLGSFSDGTNFRAVVPSKSFVGITGEMITIASIYHDGFAVTFKIY